MRYISDHLGRGFTPPPAPCILSAEYYNVGSDYSCYRPNGTKDWLIIYTLSGKGIIRNKDQEFACVGCSIAIFPAGCPHIYYTADNSNWEMIWCHFNPKPEWTHFFQLPFQPGFTYHLEIDNKPLLDKMLNAFQRLVAYTQDTLNPFWEDLCLNTLNEVLYLIAFSNMRNSDLFDNRVETVLQHMSKHYMEEIRVEDLANMVFLSASRLSHLFRQKVGESIVDVLVKIRLKKSESMLKFTERSITEIAFTVGFNSQDYYTRKFSEFFGMTPSAYRKQFSHPFKPEVEKAE